MSYTCTFGMNAKILVLYFGTIRSVEKESKKECYLLNCLRKSTAAVVCSVWDSSHSIAIYTPQY